VSLPGRAAKRPAWVYCKKAHQPRAAPGHTGPQNAVGPVLRRRAHSPDRVARALPMAARHRRRHS